MPPLSERTIGSYLDRLGSSEPAPGGGSVAGLVGALAAGLGQMVISLTRDAPDLEQVHAQLGSTIGTLLACAADDERAYTGFVNASRLPKASPEEKAARRSAMQAAMTESAEVPIRTGQALIELLAGLEDVMRHGTLHALSDAEIGISLVDSAVLACLINARANIPYLRDAQVAERLAATVDSIEQDVAHRLAGLRAIVAGRRAS